MDKKLDENIEQKTISFENKIIDFSDKNVNEIWETLLHSTKEYRLLEIDEKLKIANAVIFNDKQALNDAILKFEEWESKNPNKIKDFAENYLKQFLAKFNLKINYKLKKTSDLTFIRFEPLVDNFNIEPKNLSTGTKQIILKTLPFFGIRDDENDIFSPTNSIILIDEPENSLFPDVQREIIEHFTSMTENCQFFYATHSPIIASNFEPCERFILSFDKAGNIKVENGIAPEGTHSNQILTLDYKTSLTTEKSKKSWKRYVELRRLILFEKDKEKLNKYEQEFYKIEEKYHFSK